MSATTLLKPSTYNSLFDPFKLYPEIKEKAEQKQRILKQQENILSAIKTSETKLNQLKIDIEDKKTEIDKFYKPRPITQACGGLGLFLIVIAVLMLLATYSLGPLFLLVPGLLLISFSCCFRPSVPEKNKPAWEIAKAELKTLEKNYEQELQNITRLQVENNKLDEQRKQVEEQLKALDKDAHAVSDIIEMSNVDKLRSIPIPSPRAATRNDEQYDNTPPCDTPPTAGLPSNST